MSQTVSPRCHAVYSDAVGSFFQKTNLQHFETLLAASENQAQIAKRLESELDWIRNGRASVSKARTKNYEKAVAERKEGAAKLQQLSEG